MDTLLFEKLAAGGIISDTSLGKVKSAENSRLFSLHWELKTILYLGVLLLSGGLGILVYKNIDTIGHTAVLIFIGCVSAGGFLYCFKTKPPFSTGRVDSPNAFFDYALLLACLAFITFVGYLQYQYQFFGTRFGLVTFIPMLVLFFSAYFFDHLGILSLAITNLCAWAGITVTPMRLLRDNDFSSHTLIYTGVLVGASLIAAGALTRKHNIKAHFAFTYTNFGMHILFISLLAGMFDGNLLSVIWLVALAGVAYYFYRLAFQQRSFYFLLVLSVYGYIGLSYMVTNFIFFTLHAYLGGASFIMLYFVGTAVGMILFLINMNRKLKAHDRV